MTLDWQLTATLVIVALATGEVLRRVVATLRSRRKPGCGSGCSSCAQAPGSTLVTLDVAPTAAGELARTFSI